MYNIVFFLYCLLPEDGDLLLKHVGEFMFMDKLLFYRVYVCILIYMNDYSHNAHNK